MNIFSKQLCIGVYIYLPSFVAIFILSVSKRLHTAKLAMAISWCLNAIKIVRK